MYDKKFNEVSNKFNYIELLDKYYVGIKDNKLNVYSYSSKTAILEKDLAVSDNKYAIDFVDGINISIGENTYSFYTNGKEKVKQEVEETPDTNNEENVSENNTEEENNND